MELFELAESYAEDFIRSEDFQRLLKLKNEIKKQFCAKIIAFKTAEAKYLEAKEYGAFHPDLKDYQARFVQVKTQLYSEPLVKEYKELENLLQHRLNQDMNELKCVVSNKFKLTLF